jgi:transcription elongation GreA/GreB family factor
MGAELLGREVDDEIEVNGTYYEIIKIVAKKQQ